MDNSFALHRWAEEHLNQMRGLANPFGRIFEDYERAMSVAHLLPPPQIIDHARQIAQWIEIGGDLHEQLTRTFGANVAEGLDRMDPFHGIYGDLQQQIAQWQGLTAPWVDLPERVGLGRAWMPASAVAWDYGAGRVLEGLRASGLLATNEMLSRRLLAPTQVYTDFVAATASRLERAASAKTAKALRASLSLTEAQFIINIDNLTAILGPEVDDSPVPQVWPLTAPRVQQRELLRAVELEDEGDVTEVLRLAPSAGLAHQGGRVVRLAARCIEAAQIAGKPVPFRPTSRLYTTFAELPWRIATDKDSLGTIVDDLYLMLYEGAGGQKARYLDPDGRALKPTDCEVIQCLIPT